MRFWKSLEFETRLILSILLIMTLTLTMITVYTQVQTRKQAAEEAVRNGLLLTDNRADRLEIMLSQLEGLETGYYSNLEIQKIFRKTELTPQDEIEIRYFLSTIIQRNPLVQIADVFLELYPSGANLLVREDGGFARGNNLHLGFPKSVKHGELYAFGPHLSEDYRIPGAVHRSTVFTFQQEWYDSADGQPLACIAYDVDVNELAGIIFPDAEDTGFLSLDADKPGTAGVILERNYSFMDQDVSNLRGSCRESGWADASLRSYQGIAFGRTVSVSNLKLYMVRLVPDSDIYFNANRLLRRNMIWILCSYFLCAASIILLSRYIAAPIRKLDKSMKILSESGDLTYRVGPEINYQWNDEMGRLIARTDDMLETIETMFERQEMMSRAQREAETKMLQAQINPHFLYNSLQSIASKALQNGQEEIFDYINLLGERMHYSMDLEKTTAELWEEFRYVESYLILQNARFGNTVRSEFLLSPEAEHITVPRMILQPLAENAYKHGKICRREGTYLKLTGGIEEGILKIVMEDNGLGCTEETVDELNRKLSEIDSGTAKGIGSHIGLVNVQQRLQLFFTDRASMRIRRAESGGVRIEISIKMED